MSQFVNTLARYLPLMMFIMLLMMVWQFATQVAPSWSSAKGWFANTASFLQAHFWLIAGLAATFWLIVLVGFLHDRGRLPGFLQTRWIMDPLDRLTNKVALEQKLAEEEQPEFVDAEQLAAALKARVMGQDAVCEDIAAQVRRRLALRQRGKPIGVFLLAGPPGSGKTYLAKCLADALGRKLLHLDMTQFSRGSSAATQLFGASRGYVGSDSYGKLTATLRDIPDSVVLLDEFEKAHSEIHKNFLTAWNDGFVTEASDGSQVATTRAIFVLTTNAATDALAELATRYATDSDELRRSSTNALRESGLAPEVLNRIDRIFVFRPLSGLDIARVGALEIERMIQGYGLEVADGGIDPMVLVEMIKRQERLGNAASSRDLVRNLEERIADVLIEAKQRNVKRIKLVNVGDRVVARAVEFVKPADKA